MHAMNLMPVEQQGSAFVCACEVVCMTAEGRDATPTTTQPSPNHTANPPHTRTRPANSSKRAIPGALRGQVSSTPSPS